MVWGGSRNSLKTHKFKRHLYEEREGGAVRGEGPGEVAMYVLLYVHVDRMYFVIMLSNIVIILLLLFMS